MADMTIDSRYPSVDYLQARAKQRMPDFVYRYLVDGCDENVNLHKNTTAIRQVELQPRYLADFDAADISVELFGHKYAAPFGVAPVGLQGFMWPAAPEILAKAAFDHNIPFIQSTVTTCNLERISEITEGLSWLQLYHPAQDHIRDDILKRAAAAGCPVLVLTCDGPTAAYRPNEIRNGLAMPPKMSVRNILQMLSKPVWSMQSLKYGQPDFEVLKPYMPDNLSLEKLGQFMGQVFSTRITEAKITAIRDRWQGKLVLKGLVNGADIEAAIRLGADGVIVSNHGGRQLDAGEPTIKPLVRVAEKYGKKITIMMDSGIRSGSDIARVLACGASFAFLGRAFMLGVAALGNKGGSHTIAMLKTQFQKVMEQTGCEKTSDLTACLMQEAGRYE